MRSLTRWIFALHRYVGIGLCVLMLMWCVSGLVMMYVPYPALSESMRVAGLQALEFGPIARGPDVAPFSIEMMNGRALLTDSNGTVDLATGEAAEISNGDAAVVARTYAAGNDLAAGDIKSAVIDKDQWTVSGEFQKDRPLHKISLGDEAGTDVYVSSTSGRVVQATTAAQRIWNYVGAVPHWLYFTSLRDRPALWSEIVIWTSLLGSFLTATGLYVGFRQWLRSRRVRRWSPYRGFALWHHVPGLVFGIFLLTWVFSGLVSMNPWGFLESSGGGDAAAALRGSLPAPEQFEEFSDALPTFSGKYVSLQSAVFNDGLFAVATTSDGTRARLSYAGAVRALAPTDGRFIAGALAAGDAREDVLIEGDDFYFSHGNEEVLFPVWRFVTGNGDRYYVDAVSGTLVARMDAARRGYRWWFQGLHRFDFTAAFRARPWRDVLVIMLLSGATLVAATGAWLAVGYLRRTGGHRGLK